MGQELELIKDKSRLESLLHKQIILYGAASGGRDLKRIFDWLQIPVVAFSDSDSNKWNDKIDLIPVISPDDMMKMMDEHSVIIIASEQSREIKYNLISRGIREERIYSRLAVLMSIYFHWNDGIFSPDVIEAYKKEWKPEYALKIKRKLRLQEMLHLEDCMNMMHRDCVIIYQPGKVGSLTLKYAIMRTGRPVVQTHYLDKYNEYFGVDGFDTEFFKKQHYPVKIITIVRDPIARDFSNFFYSLEEKMLDCPNLPECPLRIESGTDSDLLDSCSHMLWLWAGHSEYKCDLLKIADACQTMAFSCRQSKKYGVEFDWFDDEFKTYTGIDIFEYPFDRESGYSIIRENNIEILVLKLERLNDMEAVIGDFIGSPNFYLESTWHTSEQSAGVIYEEAKKEIEIPEKLLDFYYENNPRVKHFYTDEECVKFRKKWERNKAKKHY